MFWCLLTRCVFALMWFTGSLDALENNTISDCSPYTSYRHQCMLVNVDDSSWTKINAVLACTGVKSVFDDTSNTLQIVYDAQEKACSWYPYCQLIHGHSGSKLCSSNATKGFIHMTEATVLKIAYDINTDKSLFTKWSKCDHNLQYRYRFDVIRTLKSMEIKKCTNKPKDVSLPSSAEQTPCKYDQACVYINYYHRLILTSLQTVFLVCSGNHSTFDHGAGLLVMKTFHQNDRQTCSSKPDCHMEFQNTPAKHCNYVENKFMNFNDSITTIYQTCQDGHEWSPWSSCDFDFTFRYQICVHGALKRFQVKLCTQPNQPSPSASAPTNYCPEEQVGDETYKGKYTFPRTLLYQKITVACRYGNINGSGVHFERACELDSHGNTTWQKLDLSMCISVSTFSNNLLDLLKMQITRDNVFMISSTLEQTLKNADSLTTIKDVDNIIFLIDKCVKLGVGDVKVSHTIFGSIATLMKFDKKTLQSGKTTGKLLGHLEFLADGLVHSNATAAFSNENLAFSKTKLLRNSDLYIITETENLKEQIKFRNAQEEHSNADVTIFIPRESIESLDTSDILYSFSFKNDKLFVSTSEKVKNKEIGSKVLSATIHGAKVENLRKKIKLTFKVPHLTNHKESTHMCSFWNESKVSPSQPIWSSSGCNLVQVVQQENRSLISCECDHLTNFAILLSPTSTNYNPPELQFVSTVGCIVSITALLFTIAVYLFFRELHRSIPQKILLNLCISLTSLLIVFMFGIESKNRLVCQIVSILIHYFTLTTFLWTFTECVSLYRSVVITFRRKGVGKRFLWSSVVISWGSPAIIAGVTSYFSKGQFNEPKPFCIIHGHLYLATTVIPVSAILILNFILFIPIMHQIQTHLSTKEKYQDRKDYTRRFRVSLSCAILLGLTWMFGIFAIGNLKITFQWIFAVLNSFQGLFIFIFHVMLKYEAKQAFRKLCGCSDAKRKLTLSSNSRSTRTIRLSML